MELRNDEWKTNFIDDDILRRIWNLEVLGVVRDFVWRGSRDVIPTKMLSKKELIWGLTFVSFVPMKHKIYFM